LSDHLLECAAAVDAALAEAPLVVPGSLERTDGSEPPPPGSRRRRFFSWRGILEGQRPDRPAYIEALHRPTEVYVTLEPDDTVVVRIECHLCPIDDEKPGFEIALMEAVEATRGSATFAERDDHLFAVTRLVDVRGIAPDSPPLTVAEITAAVTETLELAVSDPAETLASRFAAPT
jgi:hypothetical protein